MTESDGIHIFFLPLQVFIENNKVVTSIQLQVYLHCAVLFSMACYNNEFSDKCTRTSFFF